MSSGACECGACAPVYPWKLRRATAAVSRHWPETATQQLQPETVDLNGPVEGMLDTIEYSVGDGLRLRETMRKPRKLTPAMTSPIVTNRRPLPNPRRDAPMSDQPAASQYATGDAEERPWGNWRVVDTGNRFTVKRIEVNPGARISLQLHNHRSEHWVIVEGSGEVTIGGDRIGVDPGRHIFIPSDTKHRIHNTGDTTLVCVEVQFGQSLDENDITRLEDDYSRSD